MSRSQAQPVPVQHFYFPITRVAGEGEERIVEGYCFVNEVVEGEGGICLKRSAMMDATPDYLRWGAVRAMHQPIAAGTCIGVEWRDDGAYIRALIVDDQEWRKCKAGVYKGFSVGVVPKRMANRCVERCTWMETSLVDRPKDPGAELLVMRLDGAGDPESDTEDHEPNEEGPGSDEETPKEGEGEGTDTGDSVEPDEPVERTDEPEPDAAPEPGPKEGEACPSCGAILERGDDGTCNRCGAEWKYPEQRSAGMFDEGNRGVTSDMPAFPARENLEGRSPKAYKALQLENPGDEPHVPIRDGLTAHLGTGKNGEPGVHAFRFDPKQWSKQDASEWLLKHGFGTDIEDEYDEDGDEESPEERAAGMFDESKHPRDHGKFSSAPGSSGSSSGEHQSVHDAAVEVISKLHGIEAPKNIDGTYTFKDNAGKWIGSVLGSSDGFHAVHFEGKHLGMHDQAAGAADALLKHHLKGSVQKDDETLNRAAGMGMLRLELVRAQAVISERDATITELRQRVEALEEMPDTRNRPVRYATMERVFIGNDAGGDEQKLVAKLREEYKELSGTPAGASQERRMQAAERMLLIRSQLAQLGITV